MKTITQILILLQFSMISFSQNDVMINCASVHASTGDLISYPITIDPNGNTVSAISFSLYFDHLLLEAVDVLPRTGWSFFSNVNQPGRVRVSAFDINGESSPFDIGVIRFNIIGGSNRSSTMTLDVTTLGSDEAINLNHEEFNGNVFIDFSQDGNCNFVFGDMNGLFNQSFNFKAADYLRSPGIGNQTLVQANGNIEMTAGNYVSLNPGFSSEIGGELNIDIDICTDPATLVNNSENYTIEDKQKN